MPCNILFGKGADFTYGFTAISDGIFYLSPCYVRTVTYSRIIRLIFEKQSFNKV